MQFVFTYAFHLSGTLIKTVVGPNHLQSLETPKNHPNLSKSCSDHETKDSCIFGSRSIPLCSNIIEIAVFWKRLILLITFDILMLKNSIYGVFFTCLMELGITFLWLVACVWSYLSVVVRFFISVFLLVFHSGESHYLSFQWFESNWNFTVYTISCWDNDGIFQFKGSYKYKELMVH